MNLPVVLPLIKEVFRSNVAFTNHMRGKDSGWVTEWKRGKNLPSPEEAAKMCELLHTVPREILLKEEDIELVEALLAERDPGIKNPPAEAGGEDAYSKKPMNIILRMMEEYALSRSELMRIAARAADLAVEKDNKEA